ncbi:hypothetical protein IWX90DRAFT_218029 [Phyllosticta citrichinensis]|uniref:Uncharacterized protein n=1 Tax=Phyllosticta citrichinensis TaxID=1130410 RepID=A0ABR1XTT2_9PEZI
MLKSAVCEVVMVPGQTHSIPTIPPRPFASIRTLAKPPARHAHFPEINRDCGPRDLVSNTPTCSVTDVIPELQKDIENPWCCQPLAILLLSLCFNVYSLLLTIAGVVRVHDHYPSLPLNTRWIPSFPTLESFLSQCKLRALIGPSSIWFW